MTERHRRRMPRVRLDRAMVEQGLADSRTTAQRLILAGEVRVDGEPAQRASQVLAPGARLTVLARPPFVSRGGEKLAAALREFGVAAGGKTCADVGASTGGFTDCLLQHGAARVYAIDVGHGILHWKIRQDERVVVLERTNARHLDALPEPIDLVTVDVAFISLRHILPSARRWIVSGGDLVALVKPQFEAGRSAVGKGGVVGDPAVHRRVLEDVLGFCRDSGFGPLGLMRSPLRGPKGNVEFLLWAREGVPGSDLGAALEQVLAA
ncbi:MAG TPA: TlyA family RNA methyltransferase [Anaerolineales bacterium]|nr:TlyA family RNA methyltransferase [Anaerolineales bacterium]